MRAILLYRTCTCVHLSLVSGLISQSSVRSSLVTAQLGTVGGGGCSYDRFDQLKSHLIRPTHLTHDDCGKIGIFPGSELQGLIKAI